MVEAFELPRDAEGEVLPHDHPYFANGHRIIRRIAADHVVPDGNSGGQRISSALFKCDPRHGYLSVDSEQCILGIPENPTDFVGSEPWLGALVIASDRFREENKATKTEDHWMIGMDPVDGNDCHGAVWGKITTGQSNALQRNADWLVQIEGVTKQIDA